MLDKKQKRYDLAYLRMAQTWGELSHCKRKKVGALIVKDKMIISDGYNGTPSGFENACEDDDNYDNYYYSKIIGISINKINLMEHKLLLFLNFK